MLKSFLVTGTGHLFHLHTAIVQMIEEKERIYSERAAEMDMKKRTKFNNQPWLGYLPLQISLPALELIYKQGLMAQSAIRSESTSRPQPLEPCSHTFTEQFGLPCKHFIANIINNGETLQKEHVHARWWLRKPLVSACDVGIN